MKTFICKLFGHKWSFYLDDLDGKIRCKRCGKNMFGKDINVILTAVNQDKLIKGYGRMIFYERKNLRVGDVLIYNEFGILAKK